MLSSLGRMYHSRSVQTKRRSHFQRRPGDSTGSIQRVYTSVLQSYAPRLLTDFHDPFGVQGTDRQYGTLIRLSDDKGLDLTRPSSPGVQDLT